MLAGSLMTISLLNSKIEYTKQQEMRQSKYECNRLIEYSINITAQRGELYVLKV